MRLQSSDLRVRIRGVEPADRTIRDRKDASGRGRDGVDIDRRDAARRAHERVEAADRLEIPQLMGDVGDAVIVEDEPGFELRRRLGQLRDRDAVKNFSQRVERARPPMELRYLRDVADDRGLDWEYTERVLSSRDLDEWMRQSW